MNTPQTPTAEPLAPLTGSAFWTWHVRKELPDGMFTFCRYNATHGPVTAEHVRNSPHVKEWLGSDRLDEIYHPENTR